MQLPHSFTNSSPLSTSFTNLVHHTLSSNVRTDSTDFMTGTILWLFSLFCFFLQYSFCSFFCSMWHIKLLLVSCWLHKNIVYCSSSRVQHAIFILFHSCNFSHSSSRSRVSCLTLSCSVCLVTTWQHYKDCTSLLCLQMKWNYSVNILHRNENHPEGIIWL